MASNLKLPPVLFSDSDASQMPHMGVVRDFKITLAIAPPALPPMLTNPSYAAGQLQFQVVGSAGSNYIVQATTNLNSPNWISLRTNAAPFLFVETNVSRFQRRFYRGSVAP